MNNVTLVGRLTQAPELRFVPNIGTPVASFTLAVNREFTGKNGERQADFIDIQVWNKQAEVCSQYLEKGNLVSVQGSIRIDSYEDQSGIRRRSFKINASRVEFLTPKSSNNDKPKDISEFTPHFEPPQGLDPMGFTAINDDEIPF